MNNVELSRNTPAEDEQALRGKLRKMVRHASASRLKIHTDASEVDVMELPSGFVAGRILASRMVFILVSGDAFRLTFKVHFNTRASKSLPFRIFGGESPASISDDQTIDYFKEYCNLVAGNVVEHFGNNRIELGISLPICTRGFYEVFSDYAEKRHPVISYADFWELGLGEQHIFCSGLFEILDNSQLEHLIDYEIDENNDDGELDFL